MNWLVSLLLAAQVFAGTGEVGPEPHLVGLWAYFKKIYQGQEDPQPEDAPLKLRYEFKENGESALYWWYTDHNEHCARKGRYHVEEGKIIDQVTWLDPNNTMYCGQDPDMQMGKINRIPYSFKDGNLVLTIPLGDHELFYVWKKINVEEGL